MSHGGQAFAGLAFGFTTATVATDASGVSPPEQPRKVYIPERKVIAHYRAPATADYWDQLWSDTDLGYQG